MTKTKKIGIIYMCCNCGNEVLFINTNNPMDCEEQIRSFRMICQNCIDANLNITLENMFNH